MSTIYTIVETNKQFGVIDDELLETNEFLKMTLRISPIPNESLLNRDFNVYSNTLNCHMGSLFLKYNKSAYYGSHVTTIYDLYTVRYSYYE